MSHARRFSAERCRLVHLALFIPVALICSSALAGTVSFIPQTPTTVHQGEQIVFDVMISESNFASFDTAFLVIGSDSEFEFDLQYDECFVSHYCHAQASRASQVGSAGLPPLPPTSFGIFTTDIAYGGNEFSSPYFVTPLRTGILTIYTTGTPLGQHEIFVSSAREIDLFGEPLSLIARGGHVEPLEGSTIITVVPEPVGLLLFLAGMVATLRRRRD